MSYANSEAKREYDRRYYQEHRDEVRVRAHKNYHADIEKSRQTRREYAKRDSLKIYGRNVARKYGISLEEYDQILAKQGGCCAICKATEPGAPGKRFHVDHNHKTNKARGLLCGRCNFMLGHARDNPELLVLAAEYLRSYLDVA